ncbi:MAG: hypothetical protein GY822_13175 [Deltaproteobacteria bacterium]|nr:hypothetical protein [Deltaproteobacteria bacterium]
MRCFGRYSLAIEIDPESGDPTIRARGPLALATSQVTLEVTIGPVTRSFLVNAPTPNTGSVRLLLAESVDEGTMVAELDDDDDGTVDQVLNLNDID